MTVPRGPVDISDLTMDLVTPGLVILHTEICDTEALSLSEAKLTDLRIGSGTSNG